MSKAHLLHEKLIDVVARMMHANDLEHNRDQVADMYSAPNLYVQRYHIALKFRRRVDKDVAFMHHCLMQEFRHEFSDDTEDLSAVLISIAEKAAAIQMTILNSVSIDSELHSKLEGILKR